MNINQRQRRPALLLVLSVLPMNWALTQLVMRVHLFSHFGMVRRSLFTFVVLSVLWRTADHINVSILII